MTATYAPYADTIVLQCPSLGIALVHIDYLTGSFYKKLVATETDGDPRYAKRIMVEEEIDLRTHEFTAEDLRELSAIAIKNNLFC